MDLVTFSAVALVAFLAVALLTPALSFIKLRRGRAAAAGFGAGRRLGPIFFTEVLIWLAFVLLFGSAVLVTLGLAVFVLGHAAATSRAPAPAGVPLALVALVGACVAGLAVVGWRVHSFAAGKLHAPPPAAAEEPLPPSDQKKS